MVSQLKSDSFITMKTSRQGKKPICKCPLTLEGADPDYEVRVPSDNEIYSFLIRVLICHNTLILPGDILSLMSRHRSLHTVH